MRHLTFILAAIFLASGMALAAKAPTSISFGPKAKYDGFFAPGQGQLLPGLVMIHEWWGLNSNIQREAKEYSARGYNVLAVDLFGMVTSDPTHAMTMVKDLDQKSATDELLSAAQYLRSLPISNGKVGSLGWCFGGGQSLNLAINDPKLDAAVIYYGQPVTDPAQLSKIKAAILGLYGEEDKSIPLAKVHEFDAALAEAGVEHQIHTYPGAGHAFANPTNSTAYKPEAANDANARAIAFLAEHLKATRTVD